MTANHLQHLGYAKVNHLLRNPLLSNLYQYSLTQEKTGRGTQDSMVVGATYFYKDAVFEDLLQRIKPRIERLCGCSLYKTYSYVRQYTLGHELKMHRDREACEFTVSITLGFEGRAWPFWIRDKKGENLEVTLDAGDAVIFKGIELNHWREVNTYGNCSQLFLHYVNQQSIYAKYKDDTK